MADFKTRIDDLTGFGSTDDVAIVDWLTAGAREIIDVLPMSKLDRMSEIQEFTNYQGVEDSKILHVLRKDENNNDYLMPCREIHASQAGRAADVSGAYMEFATSSDPVYYLENKRVYTLPASASSDDSKLVKINEDFTIAATDTTIDNFPKEATNAVVLYASRNALMRLMNAKHGNADITTALTAINTEMDETQAIADLINTQVDAAVTEIGEMVTNVDANVDTALTAMKTAADKINTAIGLANDEYDEVAVEVTGTATSPISAARSAAVSALSISDLDLSGVSAPTVSINTVSYTEATNADASSTAIGAITVATVAKADISGDVPSYTKPVLSLSDVSIADFSISSSAPSVPSLGTVQYTDAINADAQSSSIGAITVGSVDKSDLTNNIPTYTKPTIALSSIAVGDLSISASAPSSPNLTSVSYSNATNVDALASDVPTVSFGTVPTEIDVSGSAPTYTKPTISLSLSSISDLSISASEPSAITVSTPSVSFSQGAPIFTAPTLSVDTAQFETFLETDEDVELAQLQLGRLNNEVDQYQANIQKEIASFNRDVEEYRAELKKQ